MARAVVEGEPIDAVYTLEEEAAFDEVLRYAARRGFIGPLETLAKAMRITRVNVPPIQYVWLYFVKILLGIPGVAKMSPLLLRDEAWMRQLGFNARQIVDGVTRRGDHKREPDTEREGPVSSESVAANIVKLGVLALAHFFNAFIRLAVPLAIDDDEVDVVIDCTLYETTEKYKGAGRVTRTERVKLKDGSWGEVVKALFGWKVGVAYHPRSGLPLAVCVTRINTDDRAHFWTLLGDVEKNLGTKRVKSVTMDRGFLDGEDLWRLDQRDILFVIPVRRKMRFYDDALALAGRYGEDPASPEIKVERWEDTRVRGHGKQATRETLQTEVVGVPSLTSLDSYGPPTHDKAQHNNDFDANALNAVVVRIWRGREFKSPKVFATNLDVKKPRHTFNLYDDRSLIENGVFREGKQDWSLERPPQKSEAGVTVHVYMTLAAIALTRCYRMETEERRVAAATTVAATPNECGAQVTIPQLRLGMERYRLNLKVENRNKVILFLDDAYGVLHVQEMAMLSGVNLRQRSPGVGTRDETLRKFGLQGRGTSHAGRADAEDNPEPEDLPLQIAAR